jgi:protein TonB
MSAVARHSDPLSYALLLALAIHGLLLLGVGFIPEAPSPGDKHRSSLRVVLVPRPAEAEAKVEQPELLAQVSQEGSGDQPETRLVDTRPDRKSTRLNSSHNPASRMPSSA